MISPCISDKLEFRQTASGSHFLRNRYFMGKNIRINCFNHNTTIWTMKTFPIFTHRQKFFTQSFIPVPLRINLNIFYLEISKWWEWNDWMSSKVLPHIRFDPCFCDPRGNRHDSTRYLFVHKSCSELRANLSVYSLYSGHSPFLVETCSLWILFSRSYSAWVRSIPMVTCGLGSSFLPVNSNNSNCEYSNRIKQDHEITVRWLYCHRYAEIERSRA